MTGSTMQALASLGIAGVCHGDEPVNEAEYVKRIRSDGNQALPPWDTVADRMAELEIVRRRELVRTEARRRVAAAMGYDNWDDAQGIVGENARRLLTLLFKGAAATPAEAAEIAELQAVSTTVDRVWANYLVLPDDPPPTDFHDDKWWPV